MQRIDCYCTCLCCQAGKHCHNPIAGCKVRKNEELPDKQVEMPECLAAYFETPANDGKTELIIASR